MTQPVRSLHVLGRLQPGGVESWLMHVLRNADRTRTAIDFLVHSRQPGAYDEEALRLGARVFTCPHIKNPWRYARRFKQILTEHGPYDVVHGHVYHYSGFVLRLARGLSVPVRVAHSHTDRRAAAKSAGWLRRAYAGLCSHWIDRSATVGLACSEQAAESLFGPNWTADPRYRVLHYGIDLAPFRQPVRRDAVRKELGLPTDALVVGHVGSFRPVKNHAFLLDVAEQSPRNVHFLLVGDGPLRESIATSARRRGLADRIVFAGARHDVPRLLLACDVMTLPSLYEGLGLVLIEGQAAGLPCVVSDVIPREVDQVPGLVHRRSLALPAADWARALCEAAAARTVPARSLAILEQSSFSIAASVRGLEEAYGLRHAAAG